jgi:hypothetical protein
MAVAVRRSSTPFIIEVFITQVESQVTVVSGSLTICM